MALSFWAAQNAASAPIAKHNAMITVLFIILILSSSLSRPEGAPVEKQGR